MTGKGVQVVLRKKDLSDEYWPRLLKEKGKNSRITTDWSKWVDEDEQDAEAVDVSLHGPLFPPHSTFSANEALSLVRSLQDDFGAGGMPDMGGMGGGGMPGMGAGGPGGASREFSSSRLCLSRADDACSQAWTLLA